MSKHHMGFLVLLISFMMNVAWAQTQGISFQAVLQPPGGGANPNGTNMTVKLLVLAPSLTTTHCVLRSETHTGVNITNGYLNLVVGGPSGDALADGFNPAVILSLAEALDNATARTGLHCVDGDNQIVSSGQTYTPSAGDRRILRLVVDFAPDPEIVIADFNLRSVPYAMNSETLGGKSSAAFIQSKTATKVTQTNLDQFFNNITAASGNSIRWNGSAFVAFDPSSGANLSAGSVPNSALAPIAWSKIDNASIPSALTQIVGLSCVTGNILKRGASAWVCASETVPTETDPTVATYAKNAPGAGLRVVSNVVQLDFATTATAGKAVQANDPRLSDARDAKPHSHSYASLLSTASGYMTYAPNNSICTTGQTLKWDGAKWICGDDLVGSGGGGGAETDPTVQAFAKVTPGTGLLVNGSNALTVQYGTTATTAARGDDPRLSDSRSPTAHTHPVTDITSAVNAYFTYRPNNAACSEGNVLKWNAADARWECGTDLEGTGGGGGGSLPAGTSGHFLKYSGGSWGSYAFAESDVPGLTTKLSGHTTDISSLQTAVGNLTTQVADRVSYSQLPATACTSYQTLAFSSPSGAWICTDIDYSESRLPAASDSEGGIVTTLAQSFAGVKTFLEKVIFSNDVQIDNALAVGQTVTIGGGLNVDGIANVGGLKIGVIETLACDATTAGVLRFNDDDGVIEFCNGTAWAAIGADSGGGDPGGGGDPAEVNVCAMFPPVGMPCPDGSYYSGVFRYAQRDHKVTTVAPPGCTLDATDPMNPLIECDDDLPMDTGTMAWIMSTPSGVCDGSSENDGKVNRDNLGAGACIDELIAPRFCAEMEVHEEGDYYLPSIDELKHLFENKTAIAGFASGIYWSSTEGSSVGTAKAINFSGSTITVIEKDMTETAYVRCMRQHAH